MIAVRGLPRLLVLLSFAAGLIGCGRVVGYPSALPPSCTESIPSQSAPPLQAGADALAGLEQRPIRPPAPAATGNCASSSSSLAGAVAPDYGAGVGPAYMSGQDTWYAGGQAVVLMVDARYSGPLLVRPYHLSGGGTTVTYVDGRAVSRGSEADFLLEGLDRTALDRRAGMVRLPGRRRSVHRVHRLPGERRQRAARLSLRSCGR